MTSLPFCLWQIGCSPPAATRWWCVVPRKWRWCGWRFGSWCCVPYGNRRRGPAFVGLIDSGSPARGRVERRRYATSSLPHLRGRPLLLSATLCSRCSSSASVPTGSCSRCALYFCNVVAPRLWSACPATPSFRFVLGASTDHVCLCDGIWEGLVRLYEKHSYI